MNKEEFCMEYYRLYGEPVDPQDLLDIATALTWEGPCPINIAYEAMLQYAETDKRFSRR